MNVCMIHSAEENVISRGRNFFRGRLSYVAEENTLFSEKLSPDTHGDVMILSANKMGKHISPVIYDECRRRNYSAVFLDADNVTRDVLEALSEVSSSLSRRGLSVFCPLEFLKVCPTAVPVAEASISGGVLSEHLKYLTSKHKHLALSIPRMTAEFSMPAYDTSGRELSRKELSRIIDTYDADVFFSPQMVVNYFIYSPAPENCSFVLFDDAHTITEKLRLAKRLGISDVFITYREISDIAQDIIF